MEAFARDWTFTTDEVLDQDIWWPPLGPQAQVLARGLRSGPDADLYKIEMLLGAALTLAKTASASSRPISCPTSALQFAIGQAVHARREGRHRASPSIAITSISDWAMRAHLRFFRHIAADIYLDARCPSIIPSW